MNQIRKSYFRKLSKIKILTHSAQILTDIFLTIPSSRLVLILLEKFVYRQLKCTALFIRTRNLLLDFAHGTLIGKGISSILFTFQKHHISILQKLVKS